MPYALVFILLIAPAASAAPMDPIAGEYVEARSASVYAGACHYNGEVVTTGREAVLAWRFDRGSWGGVSLAGARALVVVSSGQNLADDAPRHSEVAIDARSDAQADAVLSILRERAGLAIGEIAAVHRAPLSFEKTANGTRAHWPGHALVDVEPLPDQACCKMPHLVWYRPFVPLLDRRVGQTRTVSYSGGNAGEPWRERGANSAFYGAFEER